MAKAEAVLNRIIDSQEESGYVGATAKSFRSLERLVRGMDAYELYFVFHAFITVYEETGDKKALTAAENTCQPPEDTEDTQQPQGDGEDAQQPQEDGEDACQSDEDGITETAE